MLFTDRIHAGLELADALTEYAGRKDVILLALPRGGIPVAAEVSRKLSLPLDIMPVRKLGVPGHEEYAMGAIASGGHRVVHSRVLTSLGLADHELEAVAEREAEELARREALYRGNAPTPDLTGRTAILIDDGLATGATMEAAIAATRAARVAETVVAVPVGATESCDRLEPLADRLVCPHPLSNFRGVGLWYQKFDQVSDEEAIELLRQADSRLQENGREGRQP